MSSITHVRSAPRERLRVAETVDVFFASLATMAALTLRIVYALHHRVDSDEPQHLHVVWNWTQGSVQYRDFFDNHAPLFHLVMAPMLAFLGETADIVVRARLMMIPLVLLGSWAIYRMGAVLWSRRVGVWAAALTGLIPGFLLTSTEFRTDILWMTAWLAFLAVLLSGLSEHKKAWVSGLLLGIAFATSLKTILLLAALTLAAAFTGLALGRSGTAWMPGRGWGLPVRGLAGFLLVPTVVLLLFWRLRALPALLRCTVDHNVLPGLGFWGTAPHRLVILPAALIALALWAQRAPLASVSTERRIGRVFFTLTTALYLILLTSVWPLITSQDFLPSTPMVVLLAVAALAGAERFASSSRSVRVPRLWSTACLVLAAAVAIALVNQREPAWRDGTVKQTSLLRDVIHLTKPGEPIMDLKGETVFRPRSYYPVLEGVTKSRIRMGLLPDRIAQVVVRTRTHFAVPDDHFFPPAGRRFLNDHFVSLGSIRVLGADLSRQTPGPDSALAFDVSYPEKFAVVADGHSARGLLDGTRYAGPRELFAGVHRYRPWIGERTITAVWERVPERDKLPSLRFTATQ
jgi:Dolichyl-phosphate-mannose-protein mannosyltransferase